MIPEADAWRVVGNFNTALGRVRACQGSGGGGDLPSGGAAVRLVARNAEIPLYRRQLLLPVVLVFIEYRLLALRDRRFAALLLQSFAKPSRRRVVIGGPLVGVAQFRRE